MCYLLMEFSLYELYDQPIVPRRTCLTYLFNSKSNSSFAFKSVQSQIVLLFLNQFKVKQCFHFVSENTILKNVDDVEIYMISLFQRMQRGTINSFPVVN